MPNLEVATRLFLELLGKGRDREADDVAYNIVSLARNRTPDSVVHHLFSRTRPEMRPETEPAFLALALLLSFAEGDRSSHFLANEYFLALLPSLDPMISGRAHFHLAEIMLKDETLSPVLRSEIEASLRRAVGHCHPEATLLLGSLYAQGTLADDGEPEPRKGAEMFVRAIEEFRVGSAKRLLLAVMERHDLRVDGYDIDGLRCDVGENSLTPA